MRCKIVAVMFIALPIILSCYLPIVTEAQSSVAQSFAASTAKEPTSVAGVEIFADRPKGFDPLTATDEQLSTYGLPPRPDIQAHPKDYRAWEMAMGALKSRPSGVRAMPFYSSNMKSGKQVSALMDGLPVSTTSENWSGV